MKGRIEPAKEWEKPETPIEILVDRYVADIAESAEHIADLFPALFYDRDVLSLSELGRRMHLLKGSGGITGGLKTAMGRYTELESAPLYYTEMPTKHNPALTVTGYRINREYYTVNEFHQSEIYQQMHNFLVNRLKSLRHLDSARDL